MPLLRANWGFDSLMERWMSLIAKSKGGQSVKAGHLYYTLYIRLQGIKQFSLSIGLTSSHIQIILPCHIGSNTSTISFFFAAVCRFHRQGESLFEKSSPSDLFLERLYDSKISILPAKVLRIFFIILYCQEMVSQYV